MGNVVTTSKQQEIIEMANLEGFDAEQQEEMKSFDALPKGDYLAMAIESEMKDTKAGDGAYLQFTWQIIDGEFKGRNLWSRLNLRNPNQTAIDIANRELGDICKACKILKPKDSSELHGIPVMLNVAVEKRKDTGDMTNRIKGYKAAGGGVPAATPTPAAIAQLAPTTPTPAAPAEKPPWA